MRVGVSRVINAHEHHALHRAGSCVGVGRVINAREHHALHPNLRCTETVITKSSGRGADRDDAERDGADRGSADRVTGKHPRQPEPGDQRP